MLKGNLTLWAAIGVAVLFSVLSFIQWRGNLSLTHELVMAKDSTRVVEGMLSIVRGAADSSRISYERRLAVSDDRLSYKDRQILGLTSRIRQMAAAPKDTSKQGPAPLQVDSTNLPTIIFVPLPPETLKTTIYTPRTWWGCFKHLFGF